ncbi:MAG: class I SAM-dependent methyltransferase [Rhizobacter sp.]|nr:class I SAM-dependent methyltransferase [Chlorobiales bacterium]
MKQSLSLLQQGIVGFLQSNESWLRPLLTERVFDGLDWQREAEKIIDKSLIYPDYYKQDFHSVDGGYLNPDAALTYDPITNRILFPSEEMIRSETAAMFKPDITTVLDLACGTGTATRAVAKRFPNAQITGIDLSPYMLVAAKVKADAAQLKNISFQHANAEYLPFADQSFDAVTASLLFHELPPDAGLKVMREALRVLKPNGEFVVFDGAQSGIYKLGGNLSKELFLEPYAEAFLSGNLRQTMTDAGFTKTSSHPLLLLYDLRKGVK